LLLLLLLAVLVCYSVADDATTAEPDTYTAEEDGDEEEIGGASVRSMRMMRLAIPLLLLCGLGGCCCTVGYCVYKRRQG